MSPGTPFQQIVLDGFITGVTLRHLTCDPTLKSVSVVSLMKENCSISTCRLRPIGRIAIARTLFRDAAICVSTAAGDLRRWEVVR